MQYVSIYIKFIYCTWRKPGEGDASERRLQLVGYSWVLSQVRTFCLFCLLISMGLAPHSERPSLTTLSKSSSQEVPLWHSPLRIQCCCSSGIDCSCGSDSISGPRTSIYCGYSLKKKKKEKWTPTKFSVSSNINWHSHYGKQYYGVSKKTKNRTTTWSNSSTHGYVSRKIWKC